MPLRGINNEMPLQGMNYGINTITRLPAVRRGSNWPSMASACFNSRSFQDEALGMKRLISTYAFFLVAASTFCAATADAYCCNLPVQMGTLQISCHRACNKKAAWARAQMHEGGDVLIKPCHGEDNGMIHLSQGGFKNK
eukprot:scaffold82111_cov17-Tisochrysis_lutea.AAC.1